MSCKFAFQVASFLLEQIEGEIVLNSNQLCFSAPITTTNLLRKKIYEDQIIAFPVNSGLFIPDFFTMAVWLLRIDSSYI